MLCRQGLRSIQLREKDLPARDYYRLASAMRDITKQHGSLLFINDRVDVALACNADGVHCREKSMPADEIRRLDGRLMIGRSVHSLQGAEQAAGEGVDFLLYGPVFEPGSKQGSVPTAGIDGLRKICESVAVPVYAVGGIFPSNAGLCLAAGARGAAAVSALMATVDSAQKTTSDPARIVTEFQQALGSL